MMNKLDVNYTNEHDLSFEYLIDGQPAWEIIADENSLVPYMEVLEQFYNFKPGDSLNENYIPLTCCSCGILGCGSTSFRVRESDGIVYLDDCSGNGKRMGFKGEFKFKRENFYEIFEKIHALSLALNKFYIQRNPNLS
jgi:hypothetical protein